MSDLNSDPVETAADLIRALGGPSATAFKIGASVQAVCNMKSRGSFPGRYWPVLMKEAAERELHGVTVEWLAGLQHRSSQKDHTEAAA